MVKARCSLVRVSAPAVLSLSLVMSFGSQASAQTRDLLDLSLEELLNTEITSVSRKAQTLVGAPAAVFVISQEDIRRSGLYSVPELLRLVPGLQVARIDGSKWAISARGFNHRFSNKLLVLLDGRTFYRPTFSGVFWDTLDIMVEDIERIEVVRGPGGTMWGANAVNAVISIITKHASKTTGTLVAAGTGSEDRGLVSVRYGDTFGRGSAYRVYARMSDRAALRDSSGGSARDEWRTSRVGVRLDHALGDRDELLVQADGYMTDVSQRTELATLTPPYREVFADSGDPSGGSALGKWTRQYAPGRSVAVQAYYDASRRQDRAVDGLQSTADVEIQHRAEIGRHDLVSHAQFRSTGLDMRRTEVMEVDPALRRMTLFSGLVQDEVTLHPRVSVMVGARLEHHSTVGFALQPSVRARWTPLARHTLWGAFARAVRTPAWSERGMTFRFAVLPPEPARPLPVEILAGGSQSDRVEDVRAFEAGYRLMAGPRVSFEVAAYRNLHRAVTSYRLGTPYLHPAPGPIRLVQPLSFGADVDGSSYGIETLAQWHATKWLSLSGSHTFLDLTARSTDPSVVPEYGPNLHLHNPAHQFTARAQFNFDRVSMDAAVFRVGELPLDGVPGYTRADAGVTWSATRVLSIHTGVQNILQSQHQEFPRFVMDHPSEVPRSWYVRSTWRF